MMSLNSDNSFVLLLNTEKDILLKILSELDESTISSLGQSCLSIHRIFSESGVWEDLLQRWSVRAGLGHNFYDWKSRVTINYEFEMLEKYRSGPTTSWTLSVREPVKEMVMSDARVCLLLESGEVRLFSRQNLSQIPSPVMQRRGSVLKQINMSERYLAGVDCENILYVWSLDSSSFLISLTNYSECHLDMILTASNLHQDFILVYHNISEPLHRVHVFQISSEGTVEKVYENKRITLSSQSLSLCKRKFLEKHSSGEFVSVNLSDGSLISKLSASHRRASSQDLNFGYISTDTVFLLSRDWRTKHSHLHLYHLQDNCKLKEMDLTERLGGGLTIDKCFSVLGGVLLSVVEGLSRFTQNKFISSNRQDEREESLTKQRIFYVDSAGDWEEEESVVTQQSEVAQSCLLSADLTALLHCHRVNSEGHSLAVIQSFI